MTFGGVSFITTGDAEFYTEYAVVDAYGRDGVRADLVQIGHHGNDDATSELWLDNVSPRIALISNAMIEASLEKEVVLQGIRAVDGDYFITDRILPNTPRDAYPTHGNVIAVTDGETIELVLEEHEW
jgi:beta-lactamase superfamily II metal-dependent hydrolase